MHNIAPHNALCGVLKHIYVIQINMVIIKGIVLDAIVVVVAKSVLLRGVQAIASRGFMSVMPTVTVVPLAQSPHRNRPEDPDQLPCPLQRQYHARQATG